MSGPNMLNRLNLQPRLVHLIAGLRQPQVEEAMALLLDYIDAGRPENGRCAESQQPLSDARLRELLGNELDSSDEAFLRYGRRVAAEARAALVFPEGTDLAASIANQLEAAYNATTAGVWCRGGSTHRTVAMVAGKPDCRIAEFQHADDAQFCDVVHALAPAIIRALRTTAGLAR